MRVTFLLALLFAAAVLLVVHADPREVENAECVAFASSIA